MTPEQYITEYNLWDLNKLKEYAQVNFVYVIESSRFPNVVMLHYQDSAQYDNLWNPFNRMCRGLILDVKNRKILAYPFSKFFNLGQMPETFYEKLKELGSFQTSEKLDGSMCILFRDPNTDKLTFTTKGSLNSEHAQYANSLQMLSGFWIVAERYTRKGTLVFELISKRFQIVIDYSKKDYPEGLYLVGYRDHISNKLASYDEVANIAKELGVPTFKTYQFNSLDQLIETAKGLPVLEEGFVLRFPGDLLVKVKGSAYLAAHRFISNLSDRNILEAVADGTASTLLELAPEEYYQDVLDKINYFQNRLAELERICYNLFREAPKGFSRKEFAIWVNQHVSSHFRGFLFNLLDGKLLDQKRLCKVIEEIDCVDGKTKI